MTKFISLDQAAKLVKDGSIVMIGGFFGVGGANRIIDKLVENNVQNLTVIANDTVIPEKGIGKLIVNKQVTTLIATHIGTNPETGRQMNENELKVELIPQGTMAERIRAAGAGLGGILTQTGVNTIVEEGKEKIEIEGKEYLLELPLRAELALIKASKVDRKGNIYYNGSTRNFNTVMATAADLVIVEADEIVENGEIKAEDVMTPGIFVDYIVEG